MVLSTLLGHRGYPVDGGLILRDGRGLFGPSKTWRGVAVSVIATALMASLMGLGVVFGGVFAAFAMLGIWPRALPSAGWGWLPGIARGAGPVTGRPAPGDSRLVDAGRTLVGAAPGCTDLFRAQYMGSPLLYRWGLRRRPH